ncbi:transketolase C-terminal domain-containing protein [Georgenia sp. SUBG003]|uniref:transketolase C-terminal domain-containing protein n=1 Tax=Georgenia sp. SUBG003 TaxID=1497974 RepID=UPI003AB3AD36
MGAMVGPETFTEVRYLAHQVQLDAVDVIARVGHEFAAAFGRESGGLVRPYRTAGAETVVVALGSVLGTLKDAVDDARAAGERVGVLGVTSFRPFPYDAVREALAGARRVVVIDRALAPGVGGVVAQDVTRTCSGPGSRPGRCRCTTTTRARWPATLVPPRPRAATRDGAARHAASPAFAVLYLHGWNDYFYQRERPPLVGRRAPSTHWTCASTAGLCGRTRRVASWSRSRSTTRTSTPP